MTTASHSAPLRVLLVDDHALVRGGYARLLALEPGLEVVAELGDADAAYAWLQAPGHAADVMVLDLSMPGRSGLDLLRRLRLRWPLLRVLVCTMHDSPAMVGQALAAGAAGFVTKSSDPGLLGQAIRRVARGEQVLSPDVAQAPLAPGAEAPHRALSAREFEVFLMLARGLGVEQIAESLHISPKTAANLQALIRGKLGLANAMELLQYARQHRVVLD